MTGQHTPGPWVYRDESDMVPDEPFWIGVEHPNWGFVSHAAARAGCTEAEELGDMEANARLIAAAPELLAALVALHDNVRAQDLDDALKPPNPPSEEQYQQCMRNAAAAIAKATGSAA